MTGQYIKLPGVVAAATAGAPRILMGAADVAAMRIPALAHVVSAASLTSSAAGISGRCRKTGLALVPKGTVTALQLRTVAGHVGVGLSSLVAAALALPPGSASASYTAVVAIQIAQSDIDATASTTPNFLATMTSTGTDVATVLRYSPKSAAGAVTPDSLVSSGSNPLITANAPWALVPRPAGVWVVVAIDYNDNTRTVSISGNGAPYVSAVKTANHAPGDGGYFTIGYQLSSAGLRNSMVGDLYLFNDSLLKTPLGQTQLAAVVAGLKTDYGIV